MSDNGLKYKISRNKHNNFEFLKEMKKKKREREREREKKLKPRIA